MQPATGPQAGRVVEEGNDGTLVSEARSGTPQPATAACTNRGTPTGACCTRRSRFRSLLPPPTTAGGTAPIPISRRWTGRRRWWSISISPSIAPPERSPIPPEASRPIGREPSRSRSSGRPPNRRRCHRVCSTPWEAWMRWVEEQTGMRSVAPFEFLGSEAYGTSGAARMTAGEWRSFDGWCGHQHVPENSHWDPGKIRIDQLLAVSPEPDPVAIDRGRNTRYRVVDVAADDVLNVRSGAGVGHDVVGALAPHETSVTGSGRARWCRAPNGWKSRMPVGPDG